MCRFQLSCFQHVLNLQAVLLTEGTVVCANVLLLLAVAAFVLHQKRLGRHGVERRLFNEDPVHRGRIDLFIKKLKEESIEESVNQLVNGADQYMFRGVWTI